LYSAAPSDEELLTIGQLANHVNLNTSTIRYYEELGLISPKRKDSSNHRRYCLKEVVALNLISRAKTLGMSLEEIRELVNLFDVDINDRSGLARAVEILEEHSTEIDRKIKELRVLKKSIKQEQDRLEKVLETKGRGNGKASS
jgi:DNA-binding transcriptional MerR regulator